MRGPQDRENRGVAHYTTPTPSVVSSAGPTPAKTGALPRGMRSFPRNALRIFSGRERRRCLQIVCRSRMA
jgi:hypothetical protein